MLTHIWSMSFTDATTPAQRSAFNTAAAELPTKIDGVESFRSGTDLALHAGNYDVAIIAEFATADAWRPTSRHRHTSHSSMSTSHRCARRGVPSSSTPLTPPDSASRHQGR